MGFVNNLLEKHRHRFEPGGRLAPLFPVFEMLDTFLLTPDTVTTGRTHVRDSLDLKRMMMTVVYALLPVTIMALYNTGLQANLALAGLTESAPGGWRLTILHALAGTNPDMIWHNVLHGALYFLPVYIVTLMAGGFWEAIFALVRKHEINEGFLVTSLLYALILPPTIPLWQVAIGISFGVVIGKEVFGGTGMNIANPAILSRAFLFFAYPAQISGDRVWVAVDGITRATPLSAAAAGGVDAIQDTMWNAFLGLIPGSMGETSTLAVLIGAVILILTGMANWRIMLSVTLSFTGITALFWLTGSSVPMATLSPLDHLLLGGFAFGAIFMATDPVTAAMTSTGKYVYGSLIGIMTALVRLINPAYPEGMMLAILFGNIFAPVIDYYVIRANKRRRMRRCQPA